MITIVNYRAVSPPGYAGRVGVCCVTGEIIKYSNAIPAACRRDRPCGVRAFYRRTRRVPRESRKIRVEKYRLGGRGSAEFVLAKYACVREIINDAASVNVVRRVFIGTYENRWNFLSPVLSFTRMFERRSREVTFRFRIYIYDFFFFK